jgi:hypothetical protein
MRKNLLVFSILSLLSLMNFVALEAAGRGGGGGGGRSGGGGGRSSGGGGRSEGGGGSIQRSPSMSRASRPSPATEPQFSRPTISTHSPSYSRPQMNSADLASSASPRSEGQSATRSQLQQFMKDTPAVRPTQPTAINPAELSNRSRVNDNKAGEAGQQTKDNSRFHNAGNTARNDVNSNYSNHGNWFNHDFWDQHHYSPPYYNSNGNWWAAATASAIGGWLGWQIQPYYYDNYDNFGSSGGYWNTSDIYSDSSYSQPIYSEQSQAIGTAAANDANAQWMPLGVFTVTKNSDSPASPNMFVQLALNKTGGIAGTFYNATTDQTYALEGWVDPDSQRAAWTVAGNDQSPIITTGIYNLTQAEAPIRIYFPDGTSQDKLLVRVES